MATLIDKSYFFGDLAIGMSGEEQDAAIQEHINKREPEFLRKLFGYSLYKDFLANPSAARHLSIINGAEYVDREGIEQKWLGLKWTDNTQKLSVIANWCGYWWMRKQASYNTGTGEAEAKSENSKGVSSAPKQAQVYNEMVGWCLEFYKFMFANESTYPEYFQSGRFATDKDLFHTINPYI